MLYLKQMQMYQWYDYWIYAQGMAPQSAMVHGMASINVNHHICGLPWQNQHLESGTFGNPC